MKYRIFTLVLVFFGSFSCKKAETTVVREKTTTPGIYSKLIRECYIYTKGKDTIEASLEIEGEKFSGSLAYKFFEKDKSYGLVTGSVKGDTLIGLYTFESEGMESVREVAFLKTRNNLIEGYADMEARDGKMVFKNYGSLNFKPGTELLLTPCR